MGRKSLDITGKKFNGLTAVSIRHNIDNHQFWACRCDCGKLVVKRKQSLMSGVYANCGRCNEEEDLAVRKERERTYAAWSQMKQRVYNPVRNECNFRKKIEVCPEWKADFDAFLKDMGYKPLGKVLGRLDTNKGFYKENCIWSDRQTLIKTQQIFSGTDTKKYKTDKKQWDNLFHFMPADLKKWCVGQGPKKIRRLLAEAKKDDDILN